MTSAGPPPPPASGPASGAPPPSRSGNRRWSPSAGQIVGAILLIVMVVFILENTRRTKVRLIVPEVKAPLYVALIIAAALGCVGTLLVQYRRHRNRRD